MKKKIHIYLTLLMTVLALARCNFKDPSGPEDKSDGSTATAPTSMVTFTPTATPPSNPTGKPSFTPTPRPSPTPTPTPAPTVIWPVVFKGSTYRSDGSRLGETILALEADGTLYGLICLAEYFMEIPTQRNFETKLKADGSFNYSCYRYDYDVRTYLVEGITVKGIIQMDSAGGEWEHHSEWVSYHCKGTFHAVRQ